MKIASRGAGGSNAASWRIGIGSTVCYWRCSWPSGGVICSANRPSALANGGAEREIGVPRPVRSDFEFGPLLTVAQKQLDPAQFTLAWDEGQAMSIQDAVAEAMLITPPEREA